MIMNKKTDIISSNSNNKERQLGGSEDGGYLVDAYGNSFPPYSLSWRYLGVFIDNCNNNNNNNRQLEDADSSSCRRVLWAAYHDPDYEGNSIAEYQFYDKDTGKWDGSTCRARTYGLWWPFTRCQRLDCHEKHTSFELVGVFKETDGLYDFTEQLFKHQGYCLWDADKQDGSGDSGDNGNSADGDYSDDYEFMQTLAENWVDGCTQHDSAVDADGNALYYDTKPLKGGNITYGVYTDASCVTESKYSWSDIMTASGDNNDNDRMPSMASLSRWNELLSDFKVCQPCRAYNRVQMGQGGSGDGDNDQSEDSGDYDDGDDGEGGKEKWGFNCYDAAGYLNCNQCYKFQTQTNMEPATYDDLVSATKQGTILAIEVDGNTYGKGHFAAPGRAMRVLKKTSVVVALVGVGYLYYWIKYGRHRGKVYDADLNDKLNGNSNNNKQNGIFAVVGDKLRSFFIWKSPAHIHGGNFDYPTEIPPTSSRTVEAVAAATAKHSREKKRLVAQIRQRDATLSQQKKQIKQLQQKLDYYESSHHPNNRDVKKQEHDEHANAADLIHCEFSGDSNNADGTRRENGTRANTGDFFLNEAPPRSNTTDDE